MVELKAIEIVPPVVYAQLLTYLRLLDKRLGLMINFHVEQQSLRSEFIPPNGGTPLRLRFLNAETQRTQSTQRHI
ncbi:MAG: GxxExxY protein [Bacteroidota bacterium]|nr:GxxExxY protein [Bacteroidota bacterium]